MPISANILSIQNYTLTGNKTIVQFQSIIHPVMNFVKTRQKTGGSYKYETGKEGVTHTDLLNFIKNKDEMGASKCYHRLVSFMSIRS